MALVGRSCLLPLGEGRNCKKKPITFQEVFVGGGNCRVREWWGQCGLCLVGRFSVRWYRLCPDRRLMCSAATLLVPEYQCHCLRHDGTILGVIALSGNDFQRPPEIRSYAAFDSVQSHGLDNDRMVLLCVVA